MQTRIVEDQGGHLEILLRPTSIINLPKYIHRWQAFLRNLNLKCRFGRFLLFLVIPYLSSLAALRQTHSFVISSQPENMTGQLRLNYTRAQKIRPTSIQVASYR